jgi:hypothetical protein
VAEPATDPSLGTVKKRESSSIFDSWLAEGGRGAADAGYWGWALRYWGSVRPAGWAPLRARGVAGASLLQLSPAGDVRGHRLLGWCGLTGSEEEGARQPGSQLRDCDSHWRGRDQALGEAADLVSRVRDRDREAELDLGRPWYDRVWRSVNASWIAFILGRRRRSSSRLGGASGTAVWRSRGGQELRMLFLLFF